LQLRLAYSARGQAEVKSGIATADCLRRHIHGASVDDLELGGLDDLIAYEKSRRQRQAKIPQTNDSN
jgi:hypothetical protein